MKEQILISLVKLLLIIALVIFICFSLVRLGGWKNRKPVVMPDAHGNIILKVIDANIPGSGAARYNVYEGVKNIGWWDNITQSLRWSFILAKDAAYQAKLTR